jgi:hypothetical protein
MTKEELAIAVINLRKSLKIANKFLSDDGKWGMLCNEQEGPTFREGRAFWAEVRRLTSQDPDE